MDAQRYEVRRFEARDYPDVARISTIVFPPMPSTAEELRKWDDLTTSSPGRRWWRLVTVERSSGAMVAWGGVTHTLWNYHPQKFFIRVEVEPPHRGRGIGQFLYTTLERQAIEQEAVCLWASVFDDDPASVRFLERQAFTPLRKTWFSRLTLIDLDRPEFPNRSRELNAEGIRFTTIAAEGVDRTEVRRRLFELARITGADAPRMGDHTAPTFDEFVDVELVGPKVIPEAIFVACAGDEYVAFTSLQRVLGRPDTLDIGFTGTLPTHRGRGIASELKRQAVEYARGQGFRSISTANDSLNPRIWAINQKLGFRQEQVMIQAEKSLPSPSP